jgi:hypothetical protein
MKKMMFKKPITPTYADLHAKDLKVACTRCYAEVGEECRELDDGIVHFSRRLYWIVRERRPDLLEENS